MNSLMLLNDQGAARPERRDPVCGAVVGDPAPAFVRHEEVDYHFCSEKCLRAFLEEPEGFAA